jgi:alkanesulfonate monooxygenase SsuD/methylene tetrahydromethanopterin reductase-like flavin-dependent oxidoreductase (luciferase family)
LIGVNIIAAQTDAAARKLATTQQMSVTDLFRGERGLSKPPIDDIDEYWTGSEKMQAAGFLARSIVGSRTRVRIGVNDLIEETQADGLIIVSDVFDHGERLRSYELIADAVGKL